MSCDTCGKIINILNGYTNLLFKNEEVEGIAINRQLICNACPSRTTLAVVSNTILSYCKICKCPLSAKVRSVNEVCPLHKW